MMIVSLYFISTIKRGNKVVIIFTDAVLGMEETSPIRVIEGDTVEVCVVVKEPHKSY